jgi:hypothetical protein
MRKKLTRLLTWLVTIGLLAYLLHGISLADVRQAAGRMEPWTVPVLALLVGLVYVADSFAIWRTFGWFLARLSFREVLVVRGATYLLALVNYALGQGAIVYFVNRARGVPLMRGTGAVLLVMGINILLLLVLSTLGLLLSRDVPRDLATLVAVAYAGLLVYVVLQLWKPGFLARQPLFEVLLSAGLTGHLKALAVRIPHLCSLVLFTLVSLRAFAVEVPLGHALLCLPVVYFIAVLPISVQGLGTTQVALVYFFARFVPGGDPDFAKAVIVAASLTAQAMGLAVQALIGVVCLRSQLARNLPPTAAPAAAEPASPSPAPSPSP